MGALSQWPPNLKTNYQILQRQYKLYLIFGVYNFRKVEKFAASMKRPKTKSVSAFGRFTPWPTGGSTLLCSLRIWVVGPPALALALEANLLQYLGGRYDPQPVTRSSELVSCYYR